MSLVYPERVSKRAREQNNDFGALALQQGDHHNLLPLWICPWISLSVFIQSFCTLKEIILNFKCSIFFSVSNAVHILLGIARNRENHDSGILIFKILKFRKNYVVDSNGKNLLSKRCLKLWH